jgi:hypothetical protein
MKTASYFFLILAYHADGGLPTLNLQYVDQVKQVLTLTDESRQIHLLIHGFDQKQYNDVASICIEQRMKTLLFDVSSLYNTDTIKFTANTKPLEYGAFDPDSKIPAIFLNPVTGLMASNIAHELIHAIQYAKGFPTVPKIYMDHRREVLKNICANILHIQLTKIMVIRGFDIKSYLQPGLDSIQKGLNDRTRSIERTLTFFRAHYDAISYLRIYFEANYLSYTEKERYRAFYKKKVPVAESLARQLISIISKYDVETPSGCIKAIYASVLYLNDFDLSKSYPDFYPNAYSQFLEYWRNKYFLILDIH